MGDALTSSACSIYTLPDMPRISCFFLFASVVGGFRQESESVPAPVTDSIRLAKMHVKKLVQKADAIRDEVEKRLAEAQATAAAKAKVEQELEVAAKEKDARMKEAVEQTKARMAAAAA